MNIFGSKCNLIAFKLCFNLNRKIDGTQNLLIKKLCVEFESTDEYGNFKTKTNEMNEIMIMIMR